MRVRQVALVARELEPVVEDLCAVLGIEVGYRDPGVGVFGLVNAVMPIGDTYLEVVSPDRPGTTAGRYLERRGGDGGYMVIAQTDDLDAARKRIAELGIRIAWQTTLDDAATIHLHPRDVPGAIVSLDWMDPPESWRWAGPEWRSHVRTDVVEAITGVTVQAGDPGALAALWGRVFERPPREADGAWAIALDPGGLRFEAAADGRGDGVSAVHLRARDAGRLRARARERGLLDPSGQVRIGGVRFVAD